MLWLVEAAATGEDLDQAPSELANNFSFVAETDDLSKPWAISQFDKKFDKWQQSDIRSS